MPFAQRCKEWLFLQELLHRFFFMPQRDFPKGSLVHLFQSVAADRLFKQFIRDILVAFRIQRGLLRHWRKVCIVFSDDHSDFIIDFIRGNVPQPFLDFGRVHEFLESGGDSFIARTFALEVCDGLRLPVVGFNRYAGNYSRVINVVVPLD